MNRLFDKVFTKVNESLIDYPKTDLSKEVWDKVGSKYYLKQEVEGKILSLLTKHNPNLLKMAQEVRIVGSICSNQYLDDSDIDVHIIPKNPEYFNESSVRAIMKWYEIRRDELNAYVGKHPIEVYVQLKPAQDYLSYGLYLVLYDVWKKEPKITPLDYDPYTDFEDVLEDVRSYVEDADSLFGELKRNVVDYEVIKGALRDMPAQSRTKLLQQLVQKLKDIEDNIEDLYKEKKEWTDLRTEHSSPETPEQAKQDAELVKDWKNVDATFKFINRYKYMRTIRDLYALIEDEDSLNSNDVNIIKGIIGGK